DKDAAQNDQDVLAAVKRVEGKLGNAGRILVRASGTEPLVRIMVEAETEKLCKLYTKEVAEVLRKNGHTVK
ncbi:MAG: phosphoglucosamine mutase, partial [Clostridiales bacterium]|nr:phosphoglucosamine mutase [Clostridiales bacterium]